MLFCEWMNILTLKNTGIQGRCIIIPWDRFFEPSGGLQQQQQTWKMQWTPVLFWGEVKLDFVAIMGINFLHGLSLGVPLYWSNIDPTSFFFDKIHLRHTLQIMFRTGTWAKNRQIKMSFQLNLGGGGKESILFLLNWQIWGRGIPAVLTVVIFCPSDFSLSISISWYLFNPSWEPLRGSSPFSSQPICLWAGPPGGGGHKLGWFTCGYHATKWK